MKAYKGFNKDMTCRGFKYEEGKEYETDKAKLCSSGFHACEAPIDCFHYYAPSESVYHEVELSRATDETSYDTKKCGTKITIGAKIDFAGIVKAQFDFVKDKTVPANSATGSRSANSATGCGSANSATGSRSANSATGDWSANSATGDWSANSATGYGSANSATGDWSANSATGSRSANSATGDWSANSATGDWSANSATGCGSANSATGSRSANSATGDWSANSATGSRSANSATGSRSANSATGDWSANSATGYGSANSATGDWSANSATGYGSANVTTGEYSKNEGAEASVNIGWGRFNKCKGKIGSYLVLSEWGDWDGNRFPLKSATMVCVDGEAIKEDVWYWLKDGKVEEANEEKDEE